MFNRAFVIPRRILKSERVRFLLEIIEKYRAELPSLRRQISVAKNKISNLEEEVLQHLKDVKALKKRIKEFLKKVKDLEKEKGNLKDELERVTKTNNRLTTALFDHGNLKTKIIDLKQKKKTKGGQKGHKDTNRENKENVVEYSQKRLKLDECPHCSNHLNSVESTKDKVLIDVVINPEVVKLLLKLERQWCSNCKKEVRATHEQSLPFSEYGINTLMIILLLRFKGNLSLAKISLVLKVAFGLPIATSSVQSLLAKSKRYLDHHYQELVQQVRDGKLMYNDETGWLIGKQRAWVWIMASHDTTVYYPAMTRGSGIFTEMYGNSQAISMHDGLASYEAGLKDKTRHTYCWAHFLRFVHEETALDPPKGIGGQIKKQITNLYRSKNQSIGKEKLRQELEESFNQILDYKTRKTSIKNIQTRLTKQKEGLILALIDTPDGTNNLAERELRPVVLLRKTTNGSNTFEGMEITTTLGSVIQTLSKKDTPFFPTLQGYIQEGISKNHPNFDYS